jgi:hypothetical protein
MMEENEVSLPNFYYVALDYAGWCVSLPPTSIMSHEDPEVTNSDCDDPENTSQFSSPSLRKKQSLVLPVNGDAKSAVCVGCLNKHTQLHTVAKGFPSNVIAPLLSSTFHHQ